MINLSYSELAAWSVCGAEAKCQRITRIGIRRLADKLATPLSLELLAVGSLCARLVT